MFEFDLVSGRSNGQLANGKLALSTSISHLESVNVEGLVGGRLLLPSLSPSFSVLSLGFSVPRLGLLRSPLSAIRGPSSLLFMLSAAVGECHLGLVTG